MPLYEYLCENCGDVFEVIQKFADAPVAEHSKCGGKVHRLISAPALQFKGSGWYVNDYAKGSGTGANGSSKKDDGGPSGKDGGSGKKEDGASKSSESKSESKPAATTTSSSDTKSNS